MAYILFIIDNVYNVDWDVINITKFVETKIPTMEQRKSKFYENNLEILSVISPWYRNILPIQVVIQNKLIIFVLI